MIGRRGGAATVARAIRYPGLLYSQRSVSGLSSEGLRKMKVATARWIASATLIVALSLSQAGWAGVGLGEARVESFLGQNLNATIALLQPSENALETLQVSVASAEDHARLGVSTEALVFGLSVSLDRSAEPPVIRLRSQRPIHDPFVQVLINARWSSGRMLREYTLFLDPPSVPVAPTIRRRDEGAPAEVVPAEPERVPRPGREPEPEPEPQPEPVRPPTAPAVADPVSATPSDTVIVERGETLWSIAEQWRPDPSLTMNQAMLAIFDRNPDAFMGNNVNRLRQGARLALPDAATARAIPAGEASRRIREQTEAWRAGRTAPPAAPVVAEQDPMPVEPEPSEAAPHSEADEPAEVARLEADPEERPADLAEPVVATDAEPTPRLELSPPEEDLVAAAAAMGAERARLTSRLEELESRLSDEGLASASTDALVEQIRQAIDSADAGGLMVASEDLAILESQLREARRAREAEQLARQRQETAPEAVPEAEPRAVPVAQPGEGFLDRWMWPIAAAFVGFLLVVFLIVLLRRRAAMQDDELPREVSGQDPEPARQAAVTPSAAAAPVAEQGPQDDAPAETAAPDRDTAEQASALAGILGREEEPEEERSDADDPDPLLPEPDREPDDEDEPDLARLSNRLDPDEQDEARPAEPSLTLEDEDLDALFGTDTDATDRSQNEAEEDTGPLTLDFDLDESEDTVDAEAARALSYGDEEDGLPPTPSGEPAESVEDASLEEEPLFPEPDDESSVESEGSDDSSWFAVDEPDQPDEVSDADDVDEPEANLSDEEAEVKLDLARAYISMEDPDSARTLLEEVLADGSEAQRKQAQKLMDQLS